MLQPGATRANPVEIARQAVEYAGKNGFKPGCFWIRRDASMWMKA